MSRSGVDWGRKIRQTLSMIVRMLVFFLAVTLACSGSDRGTGQQTQSTVEPPRSVDRSFRPEVAEPTYPRGAGPLVIVDEVHHNFHTIMGTYQPFAALLEADGYVLQRGTTPVTRELLDSCRVYVIADAQPPPEAGDPPTFSQDDIHLLNQWVVDGGSLFLITDHMPDPGAIEELARSFGIEVSNGYVLNGFLEGDERPLVFDRASGTLRDSPVTVGVEQVATFAGSAFRAREGFLPVLVLERGTLSWLPEEYWKFPPGTPSIDVGGWYQGGVLEFGKGRVAFFSEAAMFTAQAFAEGRVKAGMNNALARDNSRLLLNVMRWLSG